MSGTPLGEHKLQVKRLGGAPLPSPPPAPLPSRPLLPSPPTIASASNATPLLPGSLLPAKTPLLPTAGAPTGAKPTPPLTTPSPLPGLLPFGRPPPSPGSLLIGQTNTLQQQLQQVQLQIPQVVAQIHANVGNQVALAPLQLRLSTLQSQENALRTTLTSVAAALSQPSHSSILPLPLGIGPNANSALARAHLLAKLNPVLLNFVDSTNPAEAVQRTVSVGNLGPAITEPILRQYFGLCGEVSGIQILGSDPRTATIEFLAPAAATAALVENGAMLGDRPMVVTRPTIKVAAPPLTEAEKHKLAMEKVKAATKAIAEKVDVQESSSSRSRSGSRRRKRHESRSRSSRRRKKTSRSRSVKKSRRKSHSRTKRRSRSPHQRPEALPSKLSAKIKPDRTDQAFDGFQWVPKPEAGDKSTGDSKSREGNLSETEKDKQPEQSDEVEEANSKGKLKQMESTQGKSKTKKPEKGSDDDEKAHKKLKEKEYKSEKKKARKLKDEMREKKAKHKDSKKSKKMSGDESGD